MTDQDQINEKNCCLIIKGGRLTGRALALAMRAFLRARARANSAADRREQTVAELLHQGKELPSVEISDENIKSFESTARKHGVDFQVREDLSGEELRWLVFFKSKDADAMTAAFREFSARELTKTKKPSLAQTLQKMLEKVKNQVLDQTKHKEHER